MSDPKEKKVVSFEKRSRFEWLNIGTGIFVAILIYMIIYLFAYLAQDHTVSFEVMRGTISGNYRYTALALKDETVINAAYTGKVTYYARNGAKAGAGLTVCSIDEKGKGEALTYATSLTEEDYDILRGYASGFTSNFNDSAFRQVYDFKADVLGFLLQSAQSSSYQPSTGLINLVSAPSSGFVVYSVDGMEDLTEEDITPECFNRNQYQASRLSADGSVTAGDSLFKLVSGEHWYLYFPVSRDLATKLMDRTSVRFRFLRDDTTFSAPFTVMELNGNYYGRISLNNSLYRYVGERYLDIELLMDSRVGLKVPRSAVTERTFYGVPEEYVVPNPDNPGEVMIIRESFARDGQSQTDYLTAQVYGHQDGVYLVDLDLLEPGNYVLIDQTAKKRKITENDRVTIQGVYNMNKGFAQFRQVTIVDANENFCIVEPYNIYGLAAHDFIVLDASGVKSDEILHS